MYSVIGFGLLLNYVFHTRNFGMDPYGDYTIYMIDIFGSFEATLIAYLLGVLVVLTLGMQIGYMFFKLVDSTHDEPLAVNPEVEAIEGEDVDDKAIEVETIGIEVNDAEKEGDVSS